MSRANILALSFVAAFALSFGAMAQGGGAGGGGGGAGGASGASGGTTGNSSGSMSGTSGNTVAQPSRGQSSPTGNTAAQPPGSTGQNSINSPGTGVAPGPSPGSTRRFRNQGCGPAFSRWLAADVRPPAAGARRGPMGGGQPLGEVATNLTTPHLRSRSMPPSQEPPSAVAPHGEQPASKMKQIAMTL